MFFMKCKWRRNAEDKAPAQVLDACASKLCAMVLKSKGLIWRHFKALLEKLQLIYILQHIETIYNLRVSFGSSQAIQQLPNFF